MEVSGKAFLRILAFELDLENKWDTDGQMLKESIADICDSMSKSSAIYHSCVT